MALRIAIAGHHPPFRAGLKALLKLHAEAAVVAETDRLDAIAATLERTPCDILLIELPIDRNALVRIAAFAARVKVVVIAATEQLEDVLAAIRAGARAVVFKRFVIETLIDALRTVAAGEVWMAPSVQAQIAAGLRPSQGLTRREREIARYVALGLHNGEIAQKLLIREPTVKTHLNNIFRKLDVRDRVGLTLYAIRAGIAGVDERPS